MLLFACKKESIQENHSLQTFDAGPSANGMVASPKTYTLVRHGQDTIIFKNGKISKVQRDASNFTDYYHGESSAYTVTYINGQVDNEIQYSYFPNGQLQRTMHRTWPVVNGVPTLKEVFYFYEYFADGRLKKRYNVAAVNERSEYIYDPNGNLKEVQYFYTANGQPYRKILLSYALPNTRPVPDNLKLNFRQSGFDPHMKVFGTFAKHLPVSIKVQEVGVTIADEQYAYTLNADGYPTNCDITFKNTSRSESVAFKYQGVR
jgi:hypothetical protein